MEFLGLVPFHMGKLLATFQRIHLSGTHPPTVLVRSKAPLRQEGINCCLPRPVLEVSRHRKHWCWPCPLFSHGNPEGLVCNPHYKPERKGATSDDFPMLVSDTQWHASSPKKTLTFDIWHWSSCACGRGSVPGESGVSCRVSHWATPQCTYPRHWYGMEHLFRLQFCQWCHRGRKCPGKVGTFFLVLIQIWFGYSARVV